MYKLYINENDISIDKLDEGVSIRIENSLENILINMTREEANSFIYWLQKTLNQSNR